MTVISPLAPNRADPAGPAGVARNRFGRATSRGANAPRPAEAPRRDEDELRAIMRGRPSLGSTHATGKGASARRQVRLPERTNTALDDYATAHGMTPSAVIRQALDAFLHPAA